MACRFSTEQLFGIAGRRLLFTVSKARADYNFVTVLSREVEDVVFESDLDQLFGWVNDVGLATIDLATGQVQPTTSGCFPFCALRRVGLSATADGIVLIGEIVGQRARFVVSTSGDVRLLDQIDSLPSFNSLLTVDFYNNLFSRDDEDLLSIQRDGQVVSLT